MAGHKRYGRWELISSLGGGGQSDVFRAVDTTGVLTGDYALKRLRDASRLDRFKNEIDALRRLDHPRIVPLIDHSDLSDETISRHYLVMPVATEGDAERRLPLFKGSIENVVRVAMQIADALGGAHRVNVVHRDVKPGNILFPNQGFDIWLSDFGICHLDKEIKDTPTDAIMGPRRFAAPEIEAGRASDVHPSADIYSLGQLIFYLLTSGKTFHRENVLSVEYDHSFREGERAKLLRILLNRMVAPLQHRIKSMDEVLAGLNQIEKWTETVVSAVSVTMRDKIIALRESVLTNERKRSEIAQYRQERTAFVETVARSVESFLQAKIDAVASFISESGEMETKVTLEHARPLAFRGVRLVPKAVVQFTAAIRSGLGNSTLQFWVCEETKGPNAPLPAEGPAKLVLLSARGLNPIKLMTKNKKPVPLRQDQNQFTLSKVDPKDELLSQEIGDWPNSKESLETFVDEEMGSLLDELRIRLDRHP